jgi:hypothetical protein
MGMGVTMRVVMAMAMAVGIESNHEWMLYYNITGVYRRFLGS